jgi:O-antigen ligase
MRPNEHLQKRSIGSSPVVKLSVGFVLLLLFIGGIIINPAYIFPSLAVLRPQFTFAIIAGIGLFVGVLNKSQKLNWTPIQTFYTLLQLVTIVGLGTLYHHGLFEQGFDRINDFLKTWIMLVLIGSYASRPRLFTITANYFLFIVGLFQLHSIKAMVGGDPYIQGRFDSWVGQISNSDFVGTFFACMVPLQLEMYLQQKTFFKKSVFLASALASILIMVKTQTRSAFLALIVIFVLWTLIKRNFKRRIKLAVILVVCFLLFGAYTQYNTEVKGGYFERMSTIFSPETREGDLNAQSRLAYWAEGLRIWREFPIFGCGIGALGLYQSSDLDRYTGGQSLSEISLHQTYIQILAERGIAGMICYGLFIFYTFYYLSQIKQWSKQNQASDFVMSMATGLQLGMVGFVFGGLFISMLDNYGWILIFFAGFTSAFYKSIELHTSEWKSNENAADGIRGPAASKTESFQQSSLRAEKVVRRRQLRR